MEATTNRLYTHLSPGLFAQLGSAGFPRIATVFFINYTGTGRGIEWT